MFLLVIIYNFLYTTVKHVIKNVMIGLISLTIIMIIESNHIAEKRKSKAYTPRNKSKKAGLSKQQALQPKNMGIKRLPDPKNISNRADNLENNANQADTVLEPAQPQIFVPESGVNHAVDEIITVPSVQSCPEDEPPQEIYTPKAEVLPAEPKKIQNISLLIEDKKVSTKYQKTWRRGSRLKELQERNRQRAEEEAKKLL